MNQKLPRGIVVAGVIMVTFGLAEVTTGFTHTFFAVHTAQATTSAYVGAAIGILYALAGILIFTMKKWAAALAIVLLMADIIGRIAMVVTGLYPIDSFRQTFAIILGTCIVAVLAIYVRLKWSAFS